MARTGSPIVRLLLWRGPPAVGRRVRSVVVYAIQAMAGRWLASHILQESRECVAPSPADGNSSSPISVPSGVGHPVTTPSHLNPSPIFGRPYPPTRFSVRESKRSVFLVAETPATTHATGYKVVGDLYGFPATVTQTGPCRVPPIKVGCPPDNRQAGESLARQVPESHVLIYRRWSSPTRVHG